MEKITLRDNVLILLIIVVGIWLYDTGCRNETDEEPTEASSIVNEKPWLKHRTVPVELQMIANVFDDDKRHYDHAVECSIIWSFLGTRDDPETGRTKVSGVFRVDSKNTGPWLSS